LADRVVAGGSGGRRVAAGADGFRASTNLSKALFAAGIPATAFFTKDIGAEFQRLKGLGVNFRGEPKKMGPITAVLFEDTCGNLINLVQPAS
jgi:hypothetical protein